MKKTEKKVAYVDSSIILRHAISHIDALRDFDFSESALYASDITQIECHRVLDRWRITKDIDEFLLVEARKTISAFFETIRFIPVQPPVVERACQSFPIALKSLDAIHIASAISLREMLKKPLILLTHDAKLALAAAVFDIATLGCPQRSV